MIRSLLPNTLTGIIIVWLQTQICGTPREVTKIMHGTLTIEETNERKEKEKEKGTKKRQTDQESNQ